MPKTIFLDYSTVENEFVEKFELFVNQQPEFDQLIIQNVPSALKGLQLISQSWFGSKICSYEELIQINLQIDGNLSELPKNFDFSSKNRILIAFESTCGDHESKSYWKSAGREHFYNLNIENDVSLNVTSFCHEFIANEIKNGRTGE